MHAMKFFDFVCERGYTNVLLEIANEIMNGHFHHEAIKPARVDELIVRARQRAKDVHETRLLVSTSEAAMHSPKHWSADEIDRVFDASDFILLHGGDNIETGRVGDTSIVAERIELFHSRPWYQARPRPIIFNESDGAEAFEAAIRRGASFGLHSDNQQTMWPPKWGVWEPEHLWFFNRVRELTSP